MSFPRDAGSSGLLYGPGKPLVIRDSSWARRRVTLTFYHWPNEPIIHKNSAPKAMRDLIVSKALEYGRP
jgi:hypothetical protein